ncbi:MAG: SAM-dependent methyltransferase [Labilithrix sp.]|nr:SAM-dependent methyltransferase [Labilithrix sp.]
MTLESLDDRSRARVALGEALRKAGYVFVTPTPETHRRVLARAEAAGASHARTLRDVFGWSKPFDPEVLPETLHDLATKAEVLEDAGSGLQRSRVRFASLGGQLYVHSAYPTNDEDAVFFGPDTYRFADLLRAEVPARAGRLVDVGCGTGAGGICVADRIDEVILADVSPKALGYAAVSAALAGLTERVVLTESDVLRGVIGNLDVVIANPPYLADPRSRTYRDGGGAHGEGLAIEITREALARLSPGGRLIVYTGAAIVEGASELELALRELCEQRGAPHRYVELDPDVFGEEITKNEAYADVERIAAVALVADIPR